MLLSDGQTKTRMSYYHRSQRNTQAVSRPAKGRSGDIEKSSRKTESFGRRRDRGAIKKPTRRGRRRFSKTSRKRT
ncbi:hypothetical protein EVAR_89903_1 [Eumeta japonica]|uniref:Uncharacterized protein n=1 Tax=Eumeta variegata TaxID=151549 RepID=A0A4C1YYQ3_EUMVA|nr:hypothetical protein EVAR_89903_1 [Eumeta japonica]